MGLRYNRSVNVGLGFRVNFSKSGVGYSWGVPGYRITKTARGTTRTTYSMPGTGISYVTEKSATNRSSNYENNTQPLQDNAPFIATDTYEPAEYKDFLDTSNEALDNYSKFQKYTTISRLLLIGAVVLNWLIPNDMLSLIIMIIGVLGGIAVAVVSIGIKKASTFKVAYDLNEDGEQQVKLIKMLGTCLQRSAKVWQVVDRTSVRRKTHGGASRTVDTHDIIVQEGHPRVIETNIEVPFMRTFGRDIFFLPDMILLGGSQFSAINWKDLKATVGEQRFQLDNLEKDSTLVSTSWNYVNKDGSRDKRYKNNFKVYWTQCGKIHLTTSSGFDMLLYTSNKNTAQEFAEILKNIARNSDRLRLGDGA
jgi:uncharacterized membrane protein YkvA (DUF1232 family)